MTGNESNIAWVHTSGRVIPISEWNWLFSDKMPDFLKIFAVEKFGLKLYWLYFLDICF